MIRKFLQHLQILRYLLPFFLFFTEGGILHAQQEGNMTQFVYNPVVFNPAASGADDVPSLTLHHRSQWMGIKGAPQHQTLVYSGSPFSKRLGTGLTFQNRRVGIFETQTAVLALSYSPIKTKNFTARVGLQGSLRRYGFHFNEVEEGNLLFKDNSIARDFKSIWNGNVGMGIYFKIREGYIGAGVPFVVTNLLGINDLSPSTAIEYRHLYITAGITAMITEGVNLKPAVLFKAAKNSPWNLETNLSVSVREKIILGVGYRVGQTNVSQLGESVDFITYLQATELLAFGVSYDWVLSRINNYTSGSLEAVVRFNLRRKEVTLSNPRGSDF
jgi:type IX secretion system PorP/SprF family membrane protein